MYVRLQNGLGDMTLAVYVRLQWGVGLVKVVVIGEI